MARSGKRNRDYWESRMSALEDAQYQRSVAYYEDVQKQFRMASNGIQMEIEQWYRRLADNNGASYARAKRLLGQKELQEFHWTVGQYIKAGEENAVDGRWMRELENASARHHISRLEAMKLQIRQHAEVLFTEYEGGMADFLHKSYADHYYHTAYEIARGTSVGTNLAQLDGGRINAIIRKPWAQDGANFSSRIWGNKQKLVQNLHTELAQSVIRGASPQQAIGRLAKAMDVGRSNAGRLIMTESAAIASAAQKDCFEALGVERYEILATLDGLTSEICRELDGKAFEMGDYRVGETAPPFHPNCRSTTVPYFNDEFTEGEERAARDEVAGKTYYVPAGMTYKDWEKRFVGKEATEQEQMKTSDFEWHLKNLEGLEPVKSDIAWEKEILGHNPDLLNEAHTILNKTMVEEHVEMLSIIEKGKGTVHYQKGTEINAVVLSKETLNRLKKAPDNSIILSHAHPGKTAFSQDDIRKLVDFASISDLTLECSDGTKYLLSRGTYKSSFMNKMRFDNRYAAVYNEVARKYPELEDLEKAYGVWDGFVLEVNHAVAKEFGFMFKEIQ